MNILDYYNFIHPLDSKALHSLHAVPGFDKVLKAYMKAFSDRVIHLQNMSSKVLLGPNQLPEIYNLLPPICEKFGIATPPLFLELSPEVSAYTRGDNIPDITISTGLLDHMTNEEIQIVLAHECGHILCRHLLYQTMCSIILSGAAPMFSFPGIGTALEIALLYWQRCSEFSADRASAVYCGDASKVAQIMFRLAGCPKGLETQGNLEIFMNQAQHYEQYLNDSTWNKYLGITQNVANTHPLVAVRAAEITKWGATQDFQIIISNLEAGVWKVSAPASNASQSPLPATTSCPKCGNPIVPGSAFCGACGTALAASPANAPAAFCSQCGTQLPPGGAFCPTCGRPQGTLPQAQQFTPPRQSSTDKIRNSLQSAISNPTKQQ